MDEEESKPKRTASRRKPVKEAPPEAEAGKKPSPKTAREPAGGDAEGRSDSFERTVRAPEGGRHVPDEASKEAAGATASGAGSGAEAAEEASPKRTVGREEEGVSEEDFRRFLEESLERVTVEDVVLTLMNQMASLGYLKMGLPESVNLKFRDLHQALLAVDVLEAMIKGAEGKIAEEKLRPFRGTLANLQLNYVQLKRRMG